MIKWAPLLTVLALALPLTASAAAVAAENQQAHAVRSFVGATENLAFSFLEGRSGPLIYVYFDPNCIYCHKLYDHLEPYIRAGRVRVGWIPVGFLKPDSMGKAEAILADPDPVAALARNERHFDTVNEEGSIAPAVNPANPVAGAIYTNTRVLGALGGLATPTLVLADRQHGVRIIPGMPTAMGALVRSLVALPRIEAPAS